MALIHVILAVVKHQPHSGYELWKKLTKNSGYYWQATQQQIYRELGRLEKEGAITSKVVVQKNRPDKKVYRVTNKGREILKKWLAKSADPMIIREELLVKIIAAELVSKPVIIQEIEHHRQLHVQQLSKYKEIEQEQFYNVSQLSFEQKCFYATLRYGIHYRSHLLAWCNEAIALLSENTLG